MSSASPAAPAAPADVAARTDAAEKPPEGSASKGRRNGADRHAAFAIGVATTLAAIIFGLREVLPNPNEGVTNLYALPIAIVAVRFGAIGGTIAALLSLALFAEWEMSNSDISVGAIGYLNRGTAFLVLGLIVGRFANERRLLVGRLAELATIDPLTGMANRAKFEAEFSAELARHRRHGRPGALLLADLDGFKAINDSLGHRAGDQVLKDVANVMCEQVRGTDTIARIGGDEFVVLLPDTSAEQAEAKARMLSDVVATSVRTVGGEPIVLGLSIGWVGFDGNTLGSPDQLLHAADQAMYRVKACRYA